MPFDPLAWGLGFVLTRLSNRLLQSSASAELRSKLQAEAENWAKHLPPSLSTNYEYIFGDTYEEADPESRPARFRLQATLCDKKMVPSEAEWFEAFLEHWEVKRTELGESGNSFFRLDPETARGYLAELARRIHHTCQSDAQLSLRTIAVQLGQVLSQQIEAADARRRIELTPYYARDLSPKAQALILDRPSAWEYRLFSAVLEHELGLHSSLRHDYDEGILWGKHLCITRAQDLIEWLQAHMAEAEQFGHLVAVLINERLPSALGPNGRAGDPEAIVETGKRLGEMYRRAIEWSLTLRRLSTHDECTLVVQLCSRLVENVVRQIQDFSVNLAETLHKAESDGFSASRATELTLILTVPEGVVEELNREFDRLAEYFEMRPFELL